MSERVLRDELEHLQGHARGLEAELVVEHGPSFISQREAGASALASTRSALAGLEREALTAREEESAAKAQVDRLASELQSFEQQRLTALPVVLLPLAFGVVGLLLSNGLPYAPAAFGCALSLGLLFGRRLFDWAQPGRERQPLAPNLIRSFLDGIWRNPGAGALLLSLLAGFMSIPMAAAHWSAVKNPDGPNWLFGTDDVHLLTSFPGQLVAVAAVLLALRGKRRAEALKSSGRRASLLAAGLGVLSLGAVASGWVSPLIEFVTTLVRFPKYVSVPTVFFSISAFALLPALGLAWLTELAPSKRRPTFLPLSLAFSVLCGVVTASLRNSLPDATALAGLWTAVQLGTGGLLLGWEFARREKPWWRWTGVAAAAVGLAATAVTWLLR